MISLFKLSVFCGVFFGHATQIVGSQLPDQGLNPRPEVEVWRPSHWAARKSHIPFPRPCLGSSHVSGDAPLPPACPACRAWLSVGFCFQRVCPRAWLLPLLSFFAYFAPCVLPLGESGCRFIGVIFSEGRVGFTGLPSLTMSVCSITLLPRTRARSSSDSFTC